MWPDEVAGDWIVPCAGGYFDRNHKETPFSQLQTYKAVYAAVQKSIGQGGMLKGILFWRWAGSDPTIDMASDNEATTIGTASSRPNACSSGGIPPCQLCTDYQTFCCCARSADQMLITIVW